MNMESRLYGCPECHGALNPDDDSMSCDKCSSQWKTREDIPFFLKHEKYWCNIPREEMKALNDMAIREGWEDAVRKCIPKGIEGHISRPSKADAKFFLPIDKDSIVLDVGCMWGGLTIPIAKECKEIVALDSTFETVRLLKTRADQSGIKNIKTVVADALKLPFRDKQFDVVIFNGVMEWMGMRDEFVIPNHYAKRRDKTRKYEKSPEELQQLGLNEAYRVLKDGGTLFLAIENRYGYGYFFGFVDEHSGIRFTNIMPRKIANIYMKIRMNQEYRTYTYSYNKYRKILNRTGFDEIQFYAAFQNYRKPDAIIPLENKHMIEYYLENIEFPKSKRIKEIIMRCLFIKLNLWKHVVPSYMMMAKK